MITRGDFRIIGNKIGHALLKCFVDRRVSDPGNLRDGSGALPGFRNTRAFPKRSQGKANRPLFIAFDRVEQPQFGCIQQIAARLIESPLEPPAISLCTGLRKQRRRREFRSPSLTTFTGCCRGRRSPMKRPTQSPSVSTTAFGSGAQAVESLPIRGRVDLFAVSEVPLDYTFQPSLSRYDLSENQELSK